MILATFQLSTAEALVVLILLVSCLILIIHDLAGESIKDWWGNRRHIKADRMLKRQTARELDQSERRKELEGIKREIAEYERQQRDRAA